ncbi:hypothetical protein A45J_1100 [hot springs metagenome]|uniref:Uncharacterized protein n=1 Tax=hot springs metagenome TaxID=433727 RepID=A0A5J4L3D0_9ZZZZ
MTGTDYVKRLENVIKQMLTPLNDIPFNLVIEAMTGGKVLFFDSQNSEHNEVLKFLQKAAITAAKEINKIGILRPRPNYDASHFLLPFEIYVDSEQGRNHSYKCRHYKILSSESLSLGVKFEFNSDNQRMYSGDCGTRLLAEGEIKNE